MFLRDANAVTAPEALRRIFRVRFRRASRIQAASRAANLHHGSEGGLQSQQIAKTWGYYGAERWEKEIPEDVLTEEEEREMRILYKRSEYCDARAFCACSRRQKGSRRINSLCEHLRDRQIVLLPAHSFPSFRTLQLGFFPHPILLALLSPYCRADRRRRDKF